MFVSPVSCQRLADSLNLTPHTRGRKGFRHEIDMHGTIVKNALISGVGAAGAWMRGVTALRNTVTRDSHAVDDIR